MENLGSGIVIQQVQVMTTKNGWRTFRNPSGLAFQGRIIDRGSKLRPDGSPVSWVKLESIRRIRFGLLDGSSNLIGWRTLEITPDMIGRKIAQFVSIECKPLKYSNTTSEQDSWLDQVANAGGYAAIAFERADGGVDMNQIEAE